MSLPFAPYDATEAFVVKLNRALRVTTPFDAHTHPTLASVTGHWRTLAPTVENMRHTSVGLLTHFWRFWVGYGFVTPCFRCPLPWTWKKRFEGCWAYKARVITSVRNVCVCALSCSCFVTGLRTMPKVRREFALSTSICRIMRSAFAAFISLSNGS